MGWNIKLTGHQYHENRRQAATLCSAFAPVLWPVVDEYCRLHPEVQPEVQLDDNVGDWVLDRVDIDFRFGSPPPEGVIARPLFAAQLIIGASPEYLGRHGVPRSREELSLRRCSVFRHPGTGQVFPWYVNMGGEIRTREFPPTLATNDTDLEIQATLTGQVIAQLSSLSAAALIRAGRPIPLLTEHVASHLHLYAYYGSRKALPLRLRNFIEFAVGWYAKGWAVQIPHRGPRGLLAVLFVA